MPHQPRCAARRKYVGGAQGAGDLTAKDSAKLDTAARVAAQRKSVSVEDVKAEVSKVDTGSEKLDGNLQGPNFFNQAEFPTIEFKSKSGERVGERHWKVKGDLTLRGVTKEIEVDCTISGIGKGPTGQKVGFECMFTIMRADYGMKWGIEAPKGALGNEVRMTISLEGDVAKAAG